MSAAQVRGRGDRMHEADETAEQPPTTLATPLDLLLADATSSPLRRFVPGMSGVRFTAGLARRPAARRRPRRRA